MQVIVFNQAVRHGRSQFIPGVPVAFEDADAAPYFLAAGWAVQTDAPAQHVYDQGTVAVDPLTRFAGTGQYVQPDLAEAHLAEHDGDPPPPPHEQGFNSGLIASEGGQ